MVAREEATAQILLWFLEHACSSGNAPLRQALLECGAAEAVPSPDSIVLVRLLASQVVHVAAHEDVAKAWAPFQVLQGILARRGVLLPTGKDVHTAFFTQVALDVARRLTRRGDGDGAGREGRPGAKGEADGDDSSWTMPSASDVADCLGSLADARALRRYAEQSPIGAAAAAMLDDGPDSEVDQAMNRVSASLRDVIELVRRTMEEAQGQGGDDDVRQIAMALDGLAAQHARDAFLRSLRAYMDQVDRALGPSFLDQVQFRLAVEQ